MDKLPRRWAVAIKLVYVPTAGAPKDPPRITANTTAELKVALGLGAILLPGLRHAAQSAGVTFVNINDDDRVLAGGQSLISGAEPPEYQCMLNLVFAVEKATWEVATAWLSDFLRTLPAPAIKFEGLEPVHYGA